MASDGDCLSSDELTSLLQGRAGGHEKQRLVEHLDRCRECRTVLARAAQHLTTEQKNIGFAARASVYRTIAGIAIVLTAAWFFGAFSSCGAIP